MKALTILFICICPFLKAQINLSNNAKSLAFSNCNINRNDSWSCFSNSANLVHLEESSLGFSTVLFPGLEQLRFMSMSFNKKLKKSALSIYSQSFGRSSYVQNNLGGAYGLKLSDNLSIGTSLAYNTVNLSSRRSSLTYHLGISQKYNSFNWALVYQGFDPLLSIETTTNESVSCIKIGLGYTLDAFDFFLQNNINSSEKHLSIGSQWNLSEPFKIIGSYQLTSNSLAIGLSYKFSGFLSCISYSKSDVFDSRTSLSIEYGL